MLLQKIVYMWRSLWSKGAQGAFQRFNTRRFIHTQFSKRTRIPDHRWNHYDELKLMSYSSHLAFFMLLPPVIQMYMTHVEVIRDDTLLESPFLREENERREEFKELRFNNNLSIKNRVEEELEFFNTNNNTSNMNGYKKVLDKLENSFERLQNKEIEEQSYVKIVETVISDIKIFKNQDDKYKVIESILNQLRWTKFKINEEERIFKNLLICENDSFSIKKLNLRQSIVQRYEFNKRNKTVSGSPRLIKLIQESRWLRHYVNDVERFKQILTVLIDIKVTKKIFNSVVALCLRNDKVSTSIKSNKYQLQGLINKLRENKRNDEALRLQRLSKG